MKDVLVDTYFYTRLSFISFDIDDVVSFDTKDFGLLHYIPHRSK